MLLRTEPAKVKVIVRNVETRQVVYEVKIDYTNPLRVDTPDLPVGDYTIEFQHEKIPPAHLIVKE